MMRMSPAERTALLRQLRATILHHYLRASIGSSDYDDPFVSVLGAGSVATYFW